ncbi:MAG: leucine-rich repeat protein [Clostridia bacterium]|nr:leucine-rich repeat protein [Clostridia bacterium]
MKRPIKLVISLFAISLMLTALFACSKNALPAPTGISLDDNNVLTWELVENARRYKLEITDVNSGEVKERSSTKASFSLDDQAEGNYEIRIKAISGLKDYEDSDWSRVVEFHRGYKTGCLYKLIKNNTEYQIEKAGQAEGKVIIEDRYRGKPVTSIAKLAFRGSSRIEEIVLGENVVEIGENAFWNCKNLKAVTIPENVETIGSGAFQSCAQLLEVTIPYGVTEIGDSTFAYCKSLKKVTLSDNVSVIGTAAFSDCVALDEITIPSKVKEIGEYAFSNSGVKRVTISGALEKICKNAFFKCANLTEVNFGSENKLTEIEEYAFSDCTSLFEIALPEGLKDIGKHCFEQDENLLNVTLPDSLKHIGARSFYGTAVYDAAMKTDAVPYGNDGYDVTEHYQFLYIGKWLIDISSELRAALTHVTTFSGKDSIIGNKTPKIIGGQIYIAAAEDNTDNVVFVLKDDAVGIADYVFESAVKIKTLSLPNSLKYIGNYAFAGAKELWEFKDPSGDLEEIGDYAFIDCIVLRDFDFGSKLKTIGSYAFLGCVQLDNNNQKSIIPDSVERIGTYAFKNTKLWPKNDSGISDVIYAGDWVVGYGGGNLATVTLKTGVKGIADYAFNKSATLTGVVGLANVRRIGKGAFSNCSNLLSVTLNRSLTRIEDYTFYKCSSLSVDSLPTRLEYIGRSAFYECDNIVSINLQTTAVSEIGDFAFYGCDSLTNFNFGAKLVSIGEKAFYKDGELKSVVLPDTVEEIKDKAFYKCEKVERITLGESLVKVGDYAFSTMPLVRSLVIPDSVVSVGNYSFYKLTGVTSLTLGSSLEEIGNYAFFGMEGVTELSIPASVKRIGNYAFKGMANISSIVIPASVEEMGVHAFYGAKSATFYTNAAENQGGWSERWNSSFRPTVWGCTLSDDNTYVVSVTVGEKTFTNNYVFIDTKEQNLFSAPERSGYEFAGWATTENGEAVYTAEDVVNAPIGTTLYAIWREVAD